MCPPFLFTGRPFSQPALHIFKAIRLKIVVCSFRICPRHPRKIREYIQTSGSLPDPWESNPSVVLTEPPGIPGRSLIILLRLNAARGAAPRLSPAYRFFPQWEIIAFAVNVALRHRVVSEECYAIVMVHLEQQPMWLLH